MKRECFDQRLAGEVVLSALDITVLAITVLGIAVLGIAVADARAINLDVGSFAAQKAELRT